MNASTLCIRLREQKHHQRYLCMIELMILHLDLQLCFINYDCVFRSYNCVFHDQVVLFAQRNLHLDVKESQCYHT